MDSFPYTALYVAATLLLLLLWCSNEALYHLFQRTLSSSQETLFPKGFFYPYIDSKLYPYQGGEANFTSNFASRLITLLDLSHLGLSLLLPLVGLYFFPPLDLLSSIGLYLLLAISIQVLFRVSFRLIFRSSKQVPSQAFSKTLSKAYTKASFLLSPFVLILFSAWISIVSTLYRLTLLSTTTRAQTITHITTTETTLQKRSTSTQLVQAAVNFEQKKVKEVMVPKLHLFALPITSSLEEIAKKSLDTGYSRIPIYQTSLDQMVGILLSKDLLVYLTEPEKPPSIVELLKEVHYTPENKKIDSLLEEFLAKKTHIAVVVDEYGNTKGIVTLEDILEELVGEIIDEHDPQLQQQFSIITPNSFIVDATMAIHQLEQKIGIYLPRSSHYETLGGYLFHSLGKIPPIGTKIEEGSYLLEVLTADQRRIQTVKITVEEK